MRLLAIPVALLILLGASRVAAESAPAEVGEAALAGAPVSLGSWALTVYPVGTALVELPVGNPTLRPQAFHLVLILLRADGSVAANRSTDQLRLAPGQTLWMRFTVRHGDGAESVVIVPVSDE
ncbi:MAG TPA: hypothetical protein VEQ11_07465 [Chloroflexota bacterium]|nr:hypothetical protein [Chloroflexota bacterium]